MVDGTWIRGNTVIGSGSVITTGADGDATIELGSMGKIDLRPNTSIRLAAGSEGLQLTMELCGSITQTLPSGVTSRLTLAPAKKIQFAVLRGNVSLEQENGNHKSYLSGKQIVLNKVSAI